MGADAQRVTDAHGVADAGDESPGVEYAVLGHVEVRVGGTPVPLGGRKQRGVLAVLIAAAGRPVPVDTLLQATYGDDASPGGKATLHTYVSNLRRAVGDVIVRKQDAYLLDCTDARIDAVEFEQLCERAATYDDPERASDALRHAVSLWRGHAYADIEANGYLEGEITRLSEMRLTALELRVDADLRAGRHRDVVSELDALTAEHPYRESLRGLHMLALYRCGRQAEALRAYARTRELLVDELGIDPSPELQDLERRVLGQDRTLLIDVGPTVQRRAVMVVDVDDSGWRDPSERDDTFRRRDEQIEGAAAAEDGIMLSPHGTAAYVVLKDPISAVRIARNVVNDRTRVAIDVGDLELRDDEPVGPPLSRAARLVAIAHSGQVLLSSPAHDALAAGGETGWGAESLGRFDIIGLDPGTHIFQLVGRGFRSDFPPLRTDRLPPPAPGAVERSVPGYELRHLIGVGQLGEVHRAYQPTVGREVALRIFGGGVVSHPQFVRRFETAARRISRVEHPHIVPLLDYWREPNRAVMVSRLMQGSNLAERIPPDGLSAAQTIELVDTIASAVASAHRHGVVHGRIRPENVLFDDDDIPLVADLGIDEMCSGVITFASGPYDAPERLGGALATPAADIYSFGVLVAHLLTGTPPLFDTALDVADGPAAAVVRRATDPYPLRRQQSIEELLSDLRGAFSEPASASTAFVAARNPYRGLEAFEQADSDDFFGRDRAVAEMVRVLEHGPLLLVVGPSGIGKSSAVKAGLLPALAAGAITGSEEWIVTALIPGREPFEQLAAALGRVATNDGSDVVAALMSGSRSLASVVEEVAPGHQRVLVVIDQLEELFTQTIDDTERHTFLQMLVDVVASSDPSVRVVATLRADYFDRPLAFSGFDDMIRGRTVFLGAMAADELLDAVVRPAQAVGVQVDAAVADRIVAEAEAHPGALPLVQHTLSELFANRTGNEITGADLDALGGVSGAIGRRAEQIYQSFDAPRRDAVEMVFLRLVSVSEDHADTRRRVRRTQLEQAGIAAGDLDAVLAEYGSHRLLTFDRDRASRTPTVELAHEALIVEWARFGEWIEAAREDLLAGRRLESAAHEWLNAGEDVSFLYSAGRVELADAWAAETRVTVGDDERRFLTASRARAERDRIAGSRRRRRVVSVLSVALVISLVLAATAFVQRRNANRHAAIAAQQRRNAERQADETRAGELAGLSTLAIDEDPERAILLGLAALQRTDHPSAELLSALHRATQSARVTAAIAGKFSSDITQSADGSLFAVARSDRTGYMLIDVSSGRTVADVTTANKVSDYGIAFDPTGSTLAVTEAPADEAAPVVELFDVRSHRRVRALGGPPGDYCCATQFDPAGRWLGTIDAASGSPVVWKVGGRGGPKSFGSAYDFEFSPHGASIVVGNGNRLTVFDLATSRRIRDVDTPAGVEYWDFELDPTGKLAALVSPGDLARRVDVIDLETGRLRTTLDLRDPLYAQFSPDGRHLAIGGEDSLVRVYDTDRFVERFRLAGTSGPPSQVFFSPDSSRLSAAGTGEIRTWDISASGPRVLGNFDVSGGALDRLVVAADESTAYATVYTDSGLRSSVHRVDMRSGANREIADVPYYFSTRPLVSPDLSVMATPDNDFVTQLIRLPSGSTTRLQPCDSVRAFDAEGRVAAVDSHLLCEERGRDARNASRIMDLDTGGTLLELPDTAIYAAAFGPVGNDGRPRSVVVEDRDSSTVTLYDLATRRVLGTYVSSAGRPASLAFSPDGARLALLMDTGRLVVLDVARFADGDDKTDPVVFDVVAHAAGSKAVAFSHGGLIATGSSLDGVRVWSLEGRLVASVPTHQEDTPTFAFAPGTDTLYYEDGDGVIRRFAIDVDDVTRLAHSVLTRGFTAQECARYFRAEPCPVFRT